MKPSSLVTYHSRYCKTEAQEACGIPLLPLRSGTGPAPKTDSDHDIVDEAIELFRATILFKEFKVEGPADKLIVYLTVFIQKILSLTVRSKVHDEKTISEIAKKLVKEPVPKSDDAKFYMRALGLCEAAKNATEAKQYDGYLMQVKSECAERLLKRMYDYDGMDFKYWLPFGKIKFMGKDFNNTP